MGTTLGKMTEEMPSHTVIYEAPDYEIWKYSSSIAASVRASDLNPVNPPQGDEVRYCPSPTAIILRGDVVSRQVVAMTHPSK